MHCSVVGMVQFDRDSTISALHAEWNTYFIHCSVIGMDQFDGDSTIPTLHAE